MSEHAPAFKLDQDGAWGITGGSIFFTERLAINSRAQISFTFFTTSFPKALKKWNLGTNS